MLSRQCDDVAVSSDSAVAAIVVVVIAIAFVVNIDTLYTTVYTALIRW